MLLMLKQHNQNIQDILVVFKSSKFTLKWKYTILVNDIQTKGDQKQITKYNKWKLYQLQVKNNTESIQCFHHTLCTECTQYS